VRLGCATELFATMLDIFVICQITSEDAHDCATADGQPRTRAHSQRRLARMVCSDVEEFGEAGVVEMAEQILYAFRKRIIQRLEIVRPPREPGAPDVGFLLTGSGEFLLAEIINWLRLPTRPVISLAAQLGPAVAEAFPAYAAAVLLAERLEK